MNRVVAILSFLSIISLLINSCDCWQSCQTLPKVRVVDRLTLADLFSGTNPRYSIDSVYWKRPADTAFVPLYMHQLYGSSTASYFYLPNEPLIYIKWEEGDVDTINITFKSDRQSSRCCPQGVYEPITFLLNGESCAHSEGTFILKK